MTQRRVYHSSLDQNVRIRILQTHKKTAQKKSGYQPSHPHHPAFYHIRMWWLNYSD